MAKIGAAGRGRLHRTIVDDQAEVPSPTNHAE
jgi:hypothetical protein